MALKTNKKQVRSFTLPTYISEWLVGRAKKSGVSQSELVSTVLTKYLQAERQKDLEEGYRAFGAILKDTAQSSFNLQKKVIPEY